MRRLRLALVASLFVSGMVGLGSPPANGQPPSWIQAFGAVVHRGEPSPHPREAVDLEMRRDGAGYWVAGADGSVFGFGNAPYFGSMGGTRLRDPIVDLAATPAGDGYWLAGAEGSVFGFGKAGYFGSMGGRGLIHPITSMAVTPSGRGYLLVALDGSIFGFGDAPYFGSLGDRPLNSPVVDLELTPTGRGYLLLTADGSVFGFGDAVYAGSGYAASPSPATDVASTPSGAGYWLLRLDGTVAAFGDAVAHGGPAGSMPGEAAAIALAAPPSGDGYLVLTTPGALRLSATGDIHGEGRVRDLLNRGGNPLAHVTGELHNDDLSIVNLETPVGPPGRPEVKTYVFLAPESLLPALEAGGADVVSLANNHGMDNGSAALLRTIDLSRRHGLTPVGGGPDRASAYRASLHRSRGRTVAVVGVTRVLSAGWEARPGRAGVASAYDEAAVVDAVRAAEHAADVVVVGVHWGIERDRCPDPHQRRLTRLMVDAGADVVAGHHPHVLQGLDPGPRAAVAYSLGNFVWYHSSPPSNISAILRTEHPPAGGVRAEILPAEIDGSGSPRLLSGARAEAVRREVASLQPGHGRC